MDQQPTYEELQKKVYDLQQELVQYKKYDPLIKNSLLFEALTNITTALVFAKDNKGRYTFANREFGRAFGLDQGEIIGKTDHDFMPEEMAESCFENDQKVIKEGTALGFEEKSLISNGIHTSIVVKAPMYNKKGKIFGICGISTDISERSRMEEELRTRRLKYKNLLENLAEGFFDGDPNGRFKYVNKASSEILGVSAEDLVGKTLLPFLTKESQKEGIELFQRSLKGEDIGERELSLNNGKIIQVRHKTVWDQEGKLVSVFGIIRDITEKRRVEEQIRQSEAKLRQVIDLVPHFIFAKDRDGCFILANKAVADVYNTTVDDIIGKTDADFNPHAQMVKKFLKEDQEVMDNGKTKEFPNDKLVDRKGNIRYLHTIKIPFTLSFTDKDAVLGVSTDITAMILAKKALKDQQKQLEIMVKQRTKELEKANLQLKDDKKKLKDREKELKNTTKDLNEVNTAMNALLKRREKDKIELERKLLTNVKELVAPYIKKLGKTELDSRQITYYNIIKSNLDDIVAPFLHRLSSEYHGLTPREIKIADLVRQGYTSKTIAELVGSSVRAVEFHRKNLRKKMGLTNRKANLRSHLLSLK